MSFLITVTAALLSFLFRFWRCCASRTLFSRAAIEFFRVDVGVVGEAGLCSERGETAGMDDSISSRQQK